MEYTGKTVLLKNGKACAIRRAEESDAEMLIEYLKATAGETPYLSREPEECTLSVEKERSFLREQAQSERALMLAAFVEGAFAGNCSFSGVGSYNRTSHRCSVGIALCQEFWGMGIGTALMEEILSAARAAGYEQAELEVVSTNNRAIDLYWKLGFDATGNIPQALKYRDGTYADFLFMVKKL